MITQHSLENLPEPIRDRVHRILKTIKPGHAVVMQDVADELGVQLNMIRHYAPREWLIVRRLPGRPRPITLIACPSSTKSPPKPKKR